MAGSVGKFAPSAIVLAAVGYCCWPYLEDPGRRPKVDDGKKLPELTANILSPKIIPAPGRDPFGMTGDHELFKVFDATEGKKDKNAAKKLSAEAEKAALEKAKEEAARKAAEAAEAAR